MSEGMEEVQEWLSLDLAPEVAAGNCSVPDLMFFLQLSPLWDLLCLAMVELT